MEPNKTQTNRFSVEIFSIFALGLSVPLTSKADSTERKKIKPQKSTSCHRVLPRVISAAI